jgi:hypothetical protein
MGYGPNCRHCGRPKANRPKGLCWRCSYTPGVPALYASTSRGGRRGVGNTAGGFAPCEPTDAEPGTGEKVEVLAGRAERGEQLFHLEDRRMT